MPYSQTSATAHETSKKQGQNKIAAKYYPGLIAKPKYQTLQKPLYETRKKDSRPGKSATYYNKKRPRKNKSEKQKTPLKQ